MTGQISGGIGVEELADRLGTAAMPAIIDARRQQTFMAADPMGAALVVNLAVGFASHVISRE